MIHKYTLNGFHIVLDTNSGAVHVFDDAPYDIRRDTQNKNSSRTQL